MISFHTVFFYNFFFLLEIIGMPGGMPPAMLMQNMMPPHMMGQFGGPMGMMPMGPMPPYMAGPPGMQQMMQHHMMGAQQRPLFPAAAAVSAAQPKPTFPAYR